MAAYSAAADDLATDVSVVKDEDVHVKDAPEHAGSLFGRMLI